MAANDERARVARALREMETPTWPTLMDVVFGHPAQRKKVVQRLADLIEPDDARFRDATKTIDRAALLKLADEMDGYAPHEDGRARKTVALVRSEVEGYARRIREACGVTKDGSNESGE